MLGKRSSTQCQQQLFILAIRLLLAYPLASDLGRICNVQLKLQFS